MTTKRFCMHCGAPLDENEVFCSQCGTPAGEVRRADATEDEPATTTLLETEDEFARDEEQALESLVAASPYVAGTNAQYAGTTQTVTPGQESAYIPAATRRAPAAAQGQQIQKTAYTQYASATQAPQTDNSSSRGVIMGVLAALAVIAIGGYILFPMLRSTLALPGAPIQQEDPQALTDTEQATEADEAARLAEEQRAAEEQARLAEQAEQERQAQEAQRAAEEARKEEEARKAEEEKAKQDYILPDSATRLYSREELEQLSNWELYIARNEIYARHGRQFRNQDLQDYFGSKDWYNATIAPDDFNDGVLLSDIERTNAGTMRSIEEARGSEYLK